MKKFLALLLMSLLTVVAYAGSVYTVYALQIGTYSQGVRVECAEGRIISSSPDHNPNFRSVLANLRSGDIIEVEEYNGHLLGIRKIGRERPGIISNGGVVYTEAASRGGYYTGSGYYGGGYGASYIGGGVSASFGGKHGGVSIDMPLGDIIGTVATVVRNRREAKRNRNVVHSENSVSYVDNGVEEYHVSRVSSAKRVSAPSKNSGRVATPVYRSSVSSKSAKVNKSSNHGVVIYDAKDLSKMF